VLGSITNAWRRRIALAGSAVSLGLIAGCAVGTQHSASSSPAVTSPPAARTTNGTRSTVNLKNPTSSVPVPTLTPGVSALARVGPVSVVSVHLVGPAGPGQGQITVAVFNPARTQLVLHAGSLQPVAGGWWNYGAQVGAQERTVLLAAFNGGFKVANARGGWVSEGRTAVPLESGAASVVIYADGGTDIGTWGVDVPAPHRMVVSVRQNLQLLIDGGIPQHVATSSEGELEFWWGMAYAGAPLISRSALGITASGGLVWAAGTDVTVAALAHALLAQGVQRALELDINAPLVRGFLYPDAATVVSTMPFVNGMVPLVSGQTQPGAGQSPTGADAVPHCTYLTVCSRDFFTVLIRNGGTGRIHEFPRRE
jgi:hypothetical protein